MIFGMVYLGFYVPRTIYSRIFLWEEVVKQISNTNISPTESDCLD